MFGVSVPESDLVASYADGSGTYDIYVTDEFMTTSINGAKTNDVGDVFVHRLVRAEGFDDVEDRESWLRTDRFGTCEEYGMADMVVWIDGKAYEGVWADDVYFEGIVASPVLVQCDNGDEPEGAPVYEAARLGDRWNGMEVPWFTFENATKFFADLDTTNVENRGDWRYGYDAEADVFWEAYVDDNGEAQSERNASIGFEEVDGVKLYGPFDGYTFTRVPKPAHLIKIGTETVQTIENPLTLPLAVTMVVIDRRRSYPEMGVAEAVDHARNVIGVRDLDPIGSDPLSDAYRAVLAAVPNDLIAAEASVVAEGV